MMSSEPLYNARHERFAQGISMGKKLTDAYEWAGFKLWQAHRLLNETEDKLPSLKRVM